MATTLSIFKPASKSSKAGHGALVSHKESTSVYINGVSGLNHEVRESIYTHPSDHPILFPLIEAQQDCWEEYITVKAGDLFNELVVLNSRLAEAGKIHYQIREAMRNLCSTDSPFVVINVCG